MKNPEYETRLDHFLDKAFKANHPAMRDWVRIKFELKELRRERQMLSNEVAIFAKKRLWDHAKGL